MANFELYHTKMYHDQITPAFLHRSMVPYILFAPLWLRDQCGTRPCGNFVYRVRLTSHKRKWEISYRSFFASSEFFLFSRNILTKGMFSSFFLFCRNFPALYSVVLRTCLTFPVAKKMFLLFLAISDFPAFVFKTF